MAKQNTVAFRTSLSGYNRSDVNAYILETNSTFEEKLAQAKKEAEDARAKAESADAALAQSALSLEQLQKSLAETDTVISSLRENLEALKNENLTLQQQAQAAKEREDALRVTLSEQEEKIAALQSAAAEAEAESDESEKSKKYDQISAQIGDLMINANHSADSIIAAANAKAAHIVTETENEATYIRNRLADTADAMLTQISTTLHASTDGCISELMTALHEMQNSTASLIADFERRTRELGEKIAYYQANVSETVTESLAEMDKKYGVRKPSADGK